MMKVFVAIVLFAAFALPAPYASAHQDVITLQAHEELLRSGASTDGMTKSVISSPLLEEALVSYSKKKLGGLPICGETCFVGTCYTPGCSCSWPICTKTSHEHTISAAAKTLLDEGLTAFAEKKSNLELEGLPLCGETCTFGTCYTPGCTCGYWPFCTKDSLAMCKTEL